MSDPLTQTCEREFQRYVERLFSGVVGESAFAMCSREQPNPGAYHMRLVDLACRAVRARAWFAKQGPSWCQPLPLVYYDEQEKILCSGDFARHLVVYYTNSLRGLNFDYLTHPLLFDYARGVLAHPQCPDHLRDEEELLAEFPPKPLPGLDGVDWRPPRHA
jgi:hypothetical protein